MAPAELTLLSKPPGWALSLLCACIRIIVYLRNGSLSCFSCCHTSPLLPYHPKTLGRTIILPGFPVCLGDKEVQPSLFPGVSLYLLIGQSFVSDCTRVFPWAGGWKGRVPWDLLSAHVP